MIIHYWIVRAPSPPAPAFPHAFHAAKGGVDRYLVLTVRGLHRGCVAVQAPRIWRISPRRLHRWTTGLLPLLLGFTRQDINTTNRCVSIARNSSSNLFVWANTDGIQCRHWLPLHVCHLSNIAVLRPCGGCNPPGGAYKSFLAILQSCGLAGDAHPRKMQHHRPRLQYTGAERWIWNTGMISANCNWAILSLLTVPQSTDVIYYAPARAALVCMNMHIASDRISWQSIWGSPDRGRVGVHSFRKPRWGTDSNLKAFNCYHTNFSLAAIVTRQTAFASCVSQMFLSY